MPPRAKSRKVRRGKSAFRTPFMRAFERQFIRNPAGPWPSQDHNELAIAADLATFSAVLMRGAATCFPVTAIDHESRGPVSTESVLAFLREFAEPGRMPPPEAGEPPQTRHWPASSAATPKALELGITFRAYRAAEVVGITRMLLQAVASFRKIGDGGGGGESTKIPPTVGGG
jgi:hypothetical protein